MNYWGSGGGGLNKFYSAKLHISKLPQVRFHFRLSRAFGRLGDKRNKRVKEYELICTNFWLTLCLSVASADHLCKQFGPRSGPINCRSKLFDTLMVSLKDFFEKVNFEETKNQQTKRKHTQHHDNMFM